MAHTHSTSSPEWLPYVFRYLTVKEVSMARGASRAWRSWEFASVSLPADLCYIDALEAWGFCPARVLRHVKELAIDVDPLAGNFQHLSQCPIFTLAKGSPGPSTLNYTIRALVLEHVDLFRNILLHDGLLSTAQSLELRVFLGPDSLFRAWAPTQLQRLVIHNFCPLEQAAPAEGTIGSYLATIISQSAQLKELVVRISTKARLSVFDNLGMAVANSPSISWLWLEWQFVADLSSEYYGDPSVMVASFHKLHTEIHAALSTRVTVEHAAQGARGGWQKIEGRY